MFYKISKQLSLTRYLLMLDPVPAPISIRPAIIRTNMYLVPRMPVDTAKANRTEPTKVDPVKIRLETARLRCFRHGYCAKIFKVYVKGNHSVMVFKLLCCCFHD